MAGSKSHGPGMHEYLKSARLLKVLLDRASGLKNTRTEVVYDGWPSDVSDLDTADTIVSYGQRTFRFRRRAWGPPG
jgi:hypothetical protein